MRNKYKIFIQKRSGVGNPIVDGRLAQN